MNIWWVNHYAVPPSQAGGTRHFTLSRELIRMGHKGMIIASSVNYLTRSTNHGEKNSPTRLEEIDGVRFLWMNTPPYHGNSLKRLLNMLIFSGRVWGGSWKEQFSRPDIVIGSSPHLFAALAAERLARHFAVPFVLEVRDLWPQTLIDVGDFSPRHPLVRVFAYIERFLYRKADRIITLLPGSEEHISTKGGRREHVIQIQNGIDFTLIPEPSPPAHRNNLVVLYAGAHGMANGLDTVLDAAGILKHRHPYLQVTFRFVGDGPEKYRLRNRAIRERLSNVEFLDPVPKTEIFRLFLDTDIFLFILRRSPVFQHGISPNKLFDYLAMARPIIFSADSVTNPVRNAGAGISIEPDNPLAIVNVVRQFIEMDSRKRWELGLSGRRFVEQHHDMHILASRLESVLRPLADPWIA